MVMVPPSVGTKWPLEWKKFASELKPGRKIRATEQTIGSGSEFLKLLDDPPRIRKHLIFITHGALTNGLSDPYIRLAIVQRALRSKRLARQRRVFARWAERVIRSLANERLGEPVIERLLATSPRHWRKCISEFAGWDRGDDPVPRAVLAALPHVDLTELRDILASDLPLHRSPYLETRLKKVRSALTTEVSEVWREGLLELDLDLPLLILDEAHHTKNPYTKLAGLFENQEARDEADKLRGELGGVFHRMLFLTATPFQLGHHELIEVLDRFTGVRWDDLDRQSYVRQLDELKLALDTSQAAALRLDRSWGRLSAQDAPRIPRTVGGPIQRPKASRPLLRRLRSIGSTLARRLTSPSGCCAGTSSATPGRTATAAVLSTAAPRSKRTTSATPTASRSTGPLCCPSCWLRARNRLLRPTGSASIARHGRCLPTAWPPRLRPTRGPAASRTFTPRSTTSPSPTLSRFLRRSPGISVGSARSCPPITTTH